MQGWITLHRKLMDNPLWSDANYLKLWIYCLFKASHKEHEQLVGNQMVKLERGQFVTGRNSLAQDLNKGVKKSEMISEITWWRYLKNLEKWQMLNIKVNNKFSVVTIDKYEVYQDLHNNFEQQTEQQLNNKRTTTEQQLNTNNNVNNGNNENNDIKKTSRSKLKFETHHLKLAELLSKKIKENNPDAKKPKLDSWADTFRKMMEIDGREGKVIQDLILWSQQHHFWHKNILSADKFRSQYDRLSLEFKSDNGKVGKKKSLFAQGEESKKRQESLPEFDAERAKKLKEEILNDPDLL